MSVLSGNRNFEGRINPDVKVNYLASPPLVVAYALAGTMDIDITTEPLGTGTDGEPVFLRDIWPSPQEVAAVVGEAITSDMYASSYADVFAGTDRWQAIDVPAGERSSWDPESTYVRKPPFFDGMEREPKPLTDITGAKVLAMLGDSVTTDHISPAGSIRGDSPAGQYLQEHGVEPKDFNSYGSRRGNHEVMIRGTFANIRLRNQLAPGTEGGVHAVKDGEQTTIYEASQAYQAEGTPLVILAGKEYGSGSSRDWAAKGTALLGVRAVIAESYERIHRSNLIGMGVLPLQYTAGENAESLGLTGAETFTIEGIAGGGSVPRELTVRRRRRRASRSRSASTPPASRATTSTAGSCRSSCARCSSPYATAPRSPARGRGAARVSGEALAQPEQDDRGGDQPDRGDDAGRVRQGQARASCRATNAVRTADSQAYQRGSTRSFRPSTRPRPWRGPASSTPPTGTGRRGSGSVTTASFVYIPASPWSGRPPR